FIGCRDPTRGKRIRSIDGRHPLEIDVRFSELRTNVMNIIGHSPQHCVHHRFGRIAASGAVAVDFLNPFEVDNRDNADLQESNSSVSSSTSGWPRKSTPCGQTIPARPSSV